MATKDESATGRPQVQFEDFDTDSVLDELGITDAGPAEVEEEPAREAPATTETEPPADTGPDVGSAAEEGSATEEGAPGTEATTAPEEDTPPAGTDDARPLTFTVNKREVQVEGAFIIPPRPEDGEGAEEMIVMPRSVFDRRMMPNYIGDNQAHVRALRAKDLEIADLKESRSPKEQQVEALLTHLNELYEDPDALTVFLQNFSAEAPEIRAKAENARLQAELDEVKRGKLSPEQRIEQEERAATELAEGLEHWVATLANPTELARIVSPQVAEEFKGVKLDLAGIYELLMQPSMRDVVFVTAPEDDPANHVKKGERAVNLEVVLNLMRREARLARSLGTQTKEAVQMAKTNTAAVSGGPRKRHPATGVVGDSPPPAGPQSKEPKTKQEWLDSLDRDD